MELLKESYIPSSCIKQRPYTLIQSLDDAIGYPFSLKILINVLSRILNLSWILSSDQIFIKIKINIRGKKGTKIASNLDGGRGKLRTNGSAFQWSSVFHLKSF